MNTQQHKSVLTYVSEPYALHCFGFSEADYPELASRHPKGQLLGAIDLAKQPGLLYRLRAILTDEE
ncbi:MAG: hypothetical protein OEY05_01110 [Paracoccaceae bacterium]|jgi:hypothetical protein|nr:hypothetical protein [Paracoccaceae bacterium]MDH5528609.1 hypothetical protein [Paracoccaceae bacterium]